MRIYIFFLISAAIQNYNRLRNSATVRAVAMAAFRDSEPLSFLGYGGM